MTNGPGGRPPRVTTSMGSHPNKIIFEAEFIKNTGYTTWEDGSGVPITFQRAMTKKDRQFFKNNIG